MTCWTAKISWSATCSCPLAPWYILLFCVSKWGWGFDKYLAEVNKGERGPKLPRWLKPYFQWVLPILILVILIQGLL